MVGGGFVTLLDAISADDLHGYPPRTTLTSKIGKSSNFFKNDFYDSILWPWIGNNKIITHCEL